MAEAIGVASGLLGLAAFALQSSITLSNTIKSFNSHQKRVRDLLEEIEALNGVLAPLTETVSATTDVDLSALEIPLLRCGKSCEEFEKEIMKCLSRSAGSRTSFRDWAKLKFMGEDIDGFRRLMSGYKMTINIALTDANLRKSAVTAENLQSYKDLITSATEDLESHLENMDEKLETIFEQTVTGSDSDAAERQLIKEEQLSTKKCLQICAQLSEHIDQIQLAPEHRGKSSKGIDPDSSPEKIVNEGLEECKDTVRHMKAKLEKHLQDIKDQMVTKMKTLMTSKEDFAELARLQDEMEAIRQCMAICSKADTHMNENITIIDNYGLGDSVQFLVSNEGKTIHGTNRGLGWRNRQVGGHLNDMSIQQLSRDMTSINIRTTGDAGSPSEKNASSVASDGAQRGPVPGFRERYGEGFKLMSESNPNVTKSSSRPGKSGPNSPP